MMAKKLLRGFFLYMVILQYIVAFDLTLIHTNDVHARVQQFNRFGSQCSTSAAAEGECFGGVARRKTKVDEIRASHPNTIFLDAGDQFLGTLWYTYYEGLESSYFMNLLGYDAMALGNHEFDGGPGKLLDFLDNVTFPVVSSNTDVTSEPSLAGKFNTSIILTVGGERIGIVGYITTDTALISNSGPNILFSNVITSVTNEVNSLTSQGVNKIIALGHAGFETDKLVAAIEGVDIVVGGHTNTFLYNGDQPSNDEIDGPYPFVVTQNSGKRALVVQDFTMAKYLGYLNVTFDDNGEVTSYSGNPIVMDNTIAEDPTILSIVNEMATPLVALQQEVVGFSKIVIDGERQSCRLKECLVGNMITDAIIDFHVNFTHSNTTWAPAAIALWNGGGIRSSIDKGPITLGEILTTLPFGNVVDLIRIKGSNLRAALNHSISRWNPADAAGSFLQVSGLKVVYLTDEKSVYSVEVRCVECEIPSYSPLKDSQEYNVFTSTFLIGGGDGFTFAPIRQDRFSNMITDAIIDFHVNFTHSNTTWAPAAIALWNGGGIRSSIDKGPITLGEILTTLPFGNVVDLIRIKGSNLRAALNHSISRWNPADAAGSFLQVSGLKVVYLTDEKSVYSVEVRCVECEIPSYSPLKDSQEYNVFTSTFLIGGGDGFTFAPIRQDRFNSIDSKVMADYFRKHNPAYTEIQGRIEMKTRSEVSGAITYTSSLSLVVLLLSANLT